MADDRDDPTPDPWADLEAGQGSQADEGFSFSFDALEEQPASDPPAAEGFSFTTDDAQSLPADPFAADAFGTPDAFAAADDLAADWLASAEPIEPSSEAAAMEPVIEEVDAVAATPDDLDAVAEPAAAANDDDLFSFVAADREADGAGLESSPVGGASTIEIGTGESGIVSESDILAGNDALASSTSVFDVAEGDAIATGDEGFGMLTEAADVGGAADAADMLAVGAAAAVAAPKKPARSASRPKPAKQGGLGQMIGVVLGGLMALPITYAILIWGFGKDPFKFTKNVPPDLAFLLPEKFQPGARPAGLPRLDGAPSLDDVAQAPPEPATEEPIEPEPVEPAPVEPHDEPADDLAAATPAEQPLDEPADAVAHAAAQPAPPAAPPPLDLTAVEQAVMAATDSIDAVTAVDADDPARKKLLVGWYKKLAKVGEELAVLETIAADSGRPLTAAPDVVNGLYGRIAESEGLVDDLKRLCRDWVRFEKRPANGVLLVAQIDDVKQVGPYWSSTVSLEMDDGSTKQVSVISRIEPKAAAGDRAVVAGVVFSDDVVWAADCRPLEAAAADLF